MDKVDKESSALEKKEEPKKQDSQLISMVTDVLMIVYMIRRMISIQELNSCTTVLNVVLCNLLFFSCFYFKGTDSTSQVE